jgi:tetratricopeptide (TPR) repeat protein
MNDDARTSSASSIAVNASWLVREMARAAEEVPSQSADAKSVAEAIDQCAGLLSRFWPIDVENEGDRAKAMSAPAMDDIQPGDRLGRFEIRKVLGHGGFGIVFLVYDARLSREAALKIPRPEVLLSRPLREQFLREAQAAAALDHPGIVPIFEIGEIGPIGYILSAYCKGPTLDSWRRDQASPTDAHAAATIIKQLAEAVQHAHSRGILHRDIKPANVLSDPPDDDRQLSRPFVPRLSDFGLARRLDQSVADEQARIIAGTPRYMAPEQAAGNEPEIGVHTDIYALGAVLYELLTGQPPYVGASDQDTLKLIVAGGLSLAALRDTHVPADLVAICSKCLETGPTDRYATARELSADLGHFLAGQPVTARPLKVGQRFFRACRRRPVISALSFALLVAVVVGAVVAGWQWSRAEQHLAEVEVQRAAAEENLAEAENALLDLAWIFEESAMWAPESITFRDTVNAKLSKYLERASSNRDRSALRPIVAAVYSFSARHAGLANDVKLADRNFRLALDLWRQLAADYPDNPSYSRALSLCLYNFSRFSIEFHRSGGVVDGVENEREFFRNLRDDQRFTNWSLYDFGQVVLERGDALFNMRRPKEAIDAFEVGQIAVEVLLEQAPDNFKLLLCHGQYLSRLAKEKRRLGEGQAMIALLNAATDSLEKALKHSPQDRTCRIELAETYRISGVLARGRKALADAERSLTSAAELLGSVLDENPSDIQTQRQLASPIRDLAYVHLSLGNMEKSLGYFTRCRELWRPARLAHVLSPEDQKSFALACHDEGRLAQEINKSAIARAAFAEGIEVFRHSQQDSENSGRNLSGKPKALVARSECHFYLARYQMVAGETEAARNNFQAAIDLLAPAIKRPDPDPAFKDIYAKAAAKLEELQREPLSVSGTAASQ